MFKTMFGVARGAKAAAEAGKRMVGMIVEDVVDIRPGLKGNGTWSGDQKIGVVWGEGGYQKMGRLRESIEE